MAIQRDKTSEIMVSSLAKDVFNGLNNKPKTLPSKYFYDDEGSRLFEQIMQLPEYYLTRAEMDIFRNKTSKVVELLGLDTTEPLEIIELGAGDGSKTVHLLNHLMSLGVNFVYRPVDISQEAIDHLIANLKSHHTDINIDPIITDYANIQDYLLPTDLRRWMLFLGSNLGNMSTKHATGFLKMITEPLKKGDKLLLGLDKAKSEGMVLPAYNDSKGITAKFNLNLLSRINRELGAEFNVNNFKHSPSYNTEQKCAESFIESLTKQNVFIKSLNTSFSFDKGEKLKTEISQKYDDVILSEITSELSIKHLGSAEDADGLFMDVAFEV